MGYKILKIDSFLKPYENDINLRMDNFFRKKKELLSGAKTLSSFANGYNYFGFHKTKSGWVYREWAPAASNVFLTGDFTNWQRYSYPLTPIGNGVWELFIDGKKTLYNGCHIQTIIQSNGKEFERIPLYIRRVEQNPDNYLWCGVILDEPKYNWQVNDFIPEKNPYIYECHIGMAGEKEGIGTYEEFIANVLPRIKENGYNTIQIMAIMEHPYYGSFGYQVSSFFAPCSRYGTPNGLKKLIDTAHSLGIAVLLDVVHSHAVKNTSEGINEFDGTTYQFFHEGTRGDHPAWGTKLFNYNKNEVIHFLLSNLKYWLKEYRFDGFRFDGVTSMLYHDHGLGSAFTDYGKYFSLNTDTEAVTYLQLATSLIKSINKNAIIIAEDMSAMPGMCLPIKDGGIGFDYRLSMGNPDLWVKLLKIPDENWSVSHIYYELSSRRTGEKYISYAESHDQALVGDKTIMFRLCDKEMYTSMSKQSESFIIDRGIALHKIIRLITISLGGEGYLNFMGNEFGHPEWIDFPREGNNWSYFYCRRQWSLVDNKNLKYHYLGDFDKQMIKFIKSNEILAQKEKPLSIDEEKKVITFERNGLVFVFNFSPTNSYEGYYLTVPSSGNYKVVFSSDDKEFGGFEGISKDYIYKAKPNENKQGYFQIYLPSRTAAVLKKI